MEPPEVVEDAIDFWQPRTSRPLTDEDGRQGVENVTGFFDVLERWAAATRVSPSATKDKIEAR